MEILVDVTTAEGRLTGTVRRPASRTAHPFSGPLELVACLERLCDVTEPPQKEETHVPR